MIPTAKILLLGSGELGREFVIAAKRLGCYVIACDSYAYAPAMQVADTCEVFSMLDDAALGAAIEKHQPNYIVPEIEAIRTEVLVDYEAKGFSVVPSARAAQLTMNRDAIRDLATTELGLTTSRYVYAETREQLHKAVAKLGLPLVVKPVMSSSGKGQSTVRIETDVDAAWDYAVAGMRGDRVRVIAEQFIDFDYEITLLTISARDGVHFCPAIGHRQERGDYRESWQPVAMSASALASAQTMAAHVVRSLGGYGLFGVEFFVKGDTVIFSELSPRPHDTGMVTLISQTLNQFELHTRAILGLPIPPITLLGASASAVVLADQEAEDFQIIGLADALALATKGVHVDARLFGKPTTRPLRRMGITLARVDNGNTHDARAIATAASEKISIIY
jgi:phosphoribosylglycinamide formyltransferase 2